MVYNLASFSTQFVMIYYNEHIRYMTGIIMTDFPYDTELAKVFAL